MTKRSKTDRAGELVRQLRDFTRAAADKDSMRALAERADIDPASICRFLKGSGSLTLDTADRLAAALGLRLSKR